MFKFVNFLCKCKSSSPLLSPLTTIQCLPSYGISSESKASIMKNDTGTKLITVRKRQMKIFSAKSHPKFAEKIASRMNLKLGNVLIDKFSNGETRIEILESVRSTDIFVIQTGSGDINDNIMELLLMLHTAKISSAERVFAVIPCLPYARQDRKVKSRVPISAKLLANLLVAAGTNHVITMELHASQIQGFFNISCDNLLTAVSMQNWIKENIPDWKNSVFVSPDNGGAARVTKMAEALHTDFALIHKERTRPNEVAEMLFVGNTKDKIAIILDDIADTCGTLKMAAEQCMASGATKVYAMVTHGIFSGKAIENLNNAPLEALVTTNTLPQEENLKRYKKLHVIDVSELFARAISAAYLGTNIDDLETGS